MRASLFVASLLALGAFSAGCSVIVAPDTTRLGGADAQSGLDGGGVDGGPGHDAAPGDDTGPGDDSGIDAALPDAGCASAPVCADGVITRCEGGAPVTTPCALGCAPGPDARCGEIDASNVDDALFDASARDLRIEAMLTFDTTACAPTMASGSVQTQADGSSVCVLVVHDLEIDRDGGLRVVGQRPLIILASGDVRIDGVLDASATLTEPGAGGARGGTAASTDGGGEGGGAHGAAAPDFSDGGGGGGAFGGDGGDGGDGGSVVGGEGGSAHPSTELSPLRGGSGGGYGPGSEGVARSNGGPGGAGGGAVQISALGTIRVDGAILATGGGGRGGRNLDGNWGAGGGGGSGGGILLEAPTLDLRGRLSTTGGGGGGSASSPAPGGDGRDGRDATTRAPGGTSGGTRYGAIGGDSGALTIAAGEDGDSNTMGSGNGGGGGGSVGCIVLRDAGGTGGVGSGAFLSPSSVTISPLRLR